MKLPNFVNPSTYSMSKIGRGFSDNVVQKLKLSENYFHKKCAPRGAFFNKKRNGNIPMS